MPFSQINPHWENKARSSGVTTAEKLGWRKHHKEMITSVAPSFSAYNFDSAELKLVFSHLDLCRCVVGATFMARLLTLASQRHRTEQAPRVLQQDCFPSARGSGTLHHEPVARGGVREPTKDAGDASTGIPRPRRVAATLQVQCPHEAWQSTQSLILIVHTELDSPHRAWQSTQSLTVQTVLDSPHRAWQST